MDTSLEKFKKSNILLHKIMYQELALIMCLFNNFAY